MSPVAAAVAVAGAGLAAAFGLVVWPRETAARPPLVAEQPAVWAGERVDGLPLAAVLRSGEGGHVSFVYGDCVPADDVGCPPPAEVQVWPACRRNLALTRGSPIGVTAESVTVRGVPGLSLDGGRRLELQSGRLTIVVFADSRARATRMAAALSTQDGTVVPGRPLPAPAPGALEEVVDC